MSHLHVEPEEAGEWVEIGPGFKVKRDGSQGQWTDEKGALCNACDGLWIAAYRKGLEVALEQTRELVEAVLVEDSCTHWFNHSLMEIRISRWDAIAAAAKKAVKL